MTWSMNAHGSVDPSLTDEQAQELEAQLADALHKVLSRPEFGTQHSSFGARWWQGRVHIAHEPPPAPAQPATEEAAGDTSSEPTDAAPSAGQQEEDS